MSSASDPTPTTSMADPVPANTNPDKEVVPSSDQNMDVDVPDKVAAVETGVDGGIVIPGEVEKRGDGDGVEREKTPVEREAEIVPTSATGQDIIAPSSGARNQSSSPISSLEGTPTAVVVRGSAPDPAPEEVDDRRKLVSAGSTLGEEIAAGSTTGAGASGEETPMEVDQENPASSFNTGEESEIEDDGKVPMTPAQLEQAARLRSTSGSAPTEPAVEAPVKTIPKDKGKGVMRPSTSVRKPNPPEPESDDEVEYMGESTPKAETKSTTKRKGAARMETTDELSTKPIPTLEKWNERMTYQYAVPVPKGNFDRKPLLGIYPDLPRKIECPQIVLCSIKHWQPPIWDEVQFFNPKTAMAILLRARRVLFWIPYCYLNVWRLGPFLLSITHHEACCYCNEEGGKICGRMPSGSCVVSTKNGHQSWVKREIVEDKGRFEYVNVLFCEVLLSDVGFGKDKYDHFLPIPFEHFEPCLATLNLAKSGKKFMAAPYDPTGRRNLQELDRKSLEQVKNVMVPKTMRTYYRVTFYRQLELEYLEKYFPAKFDVWTADQAKRAEARAAKKLAKEEAKKPKASGSKRKVEAMEDDEEEEASNGDDEDDRPVSVEPVAGPSRYNTRSSRKPAASAPPATKKAKIEKSGKKTKIETTDVVGPSSAVSLHPRVIGNRLPRGSLLKAFSESVPPTSARRDVSQVIAGTSSLTEPAMNEIRNHFRSVYDNARKTRKLRRGIKEVLALQKNTNPKNSASIAKLEALVDKARDRVSKLTESAEDFANFIGMFTTIDSSDSEGPDIRKNQAGIVEEEEEDEEEEVPSEEESVEM